MRSLDVETARRLGSIVRLFHLEQSGRANRFYFWALHGRRVAFVGIVSQVLTGTRTDPARLHDPRNCDAGLHLLFSTSHRRRILFLTPEAVTRPKQKERNPQQQDNREQRAGGKILSSVHSAQIVALSIFNADRASVSSVSS
jgi:hypothetical protein